MIAACLVGDKPYDGERSKLAESKRLAALTKFHLFLIVLLLWLLTIPTPAQDVPQPINADTVQRLQSVARIDYLDLDAEFDTGAFWIDETGERIVFFDAFGTQFVADSQGQIIAIDDTFTSETRLPGAVVGVAFADEAIYTLVQRGGATLLNGEQLDLEGLALALWHHEESLYIEVIGPEGEPAIDIFAAEDFSPLGQLPYGPAEREEAVVRVGRIPPPYTVTSDATGAVTLWSLAPEPQTLYDVDNGTDQPSVFGNINADATHLVWRDNPNESLYLLDFAEGDNRFIDALGGAYAQWFFLSNDASTILAVNLDFEPVVVAWEAVTGERVVLGEYRVCGRPQPDMSRLSADGTTLVIGCDTGLDIWRVGSE